ncbi:MULTISPECIES: hypothetical protein [Pseudomonas]|uniref:hypothetical protein n=1 Tax=Pseudomonas TaxID=286 RepID=UPI001C0A83D0|nr:MULTISPECIES: hypothetical protein [Pseudomonas]MCK3839894.1 hypothetical protein [Pseudomonas sp. NCIMB 10586]VCU63584.1 hypothetical protein [Pseudomonas synxantha]
MLNYIQYRMDLHKHARYSLKHQLSQPPNSEEAYERGDLEEYHRESDRLYEWRLLILTGYLRSVADDLIVPMPALDDKSMYQQVDWNDDPREPKYLTPEGIRFVRAAIREEQKHRREVWSFRLAGVTGLGGTVIGVLSMMKVFG